MKGFTTMTNAEASTSETVAAVAEQGATVAPETTSSKKGASQKKDAPKGQKAAEDSKAKPAPKKGCQGWQEGCQTHPGQGSQRASRRKQRREDPGSDRPAQGCDPGRDRESNLLAGALRTRFPLHRCQARA